VFENAVLRSIFEPKRDDVTREWRKLHNAELHNLYSSPIIIIRQLTSRQIRWAWRVARTVEERKSLRFGGKARRKETIWKTEAKMGRVHNGS
jgi:hypothetical protein